MKKRVHLFKAFVFMAMLLVSSLAWAGPFLVCSPSENVDSYELRINGSVVSVVPDPTGKHGFSFDLAEYSNGSYTVYARAGNIWGWSEWSDPFEYTAAKPSIPAGLAIEK